MASRGAETVVYVVERSLGLTEEDARASVLVLEQHLVEKLMYNPKDEVAVVTFGTKGTSNDLHVEIGGYEGITVAVPWQPVSEGAVTAVHQIAQDDRAANADFLSAIVVAMDLLVKAKGILKKGNKKIVLITAASSALESAGDDISNEEQVGQLSDQLSAQGVRIEVVLVPPGPQVKEQRVAEGSEGGASLLRQANVELLKHFLGPTPGVPSCKAGDAGLEWAPPDSVDGSKLILETSLGSMREVGSCRELLFKGRHRVQPTTAYRGDIQLTPDLRIQVWAYKKTVRQRMPTLKVFSEEAPAGDSSATHDVRMEREFHLRANPDVTIPAQELVRAYKYGPQVIPISDLERAAMRFHAEKGIQLLGFTTRERIPRHYFMGEVTLFLPPPGDSLAAVALSALARALDAQGRVAVARCKFTQREDAGVVLAALTPALAQDETLLDALWCNTLPFAEDIREFLFAPLDSHPPRLQPSAAQLQAAEALVRGLDLGPTLVKGAAAADAAAAAEAGTESLEPEKTFSPSLQEYLELVRSRLLLSDGASLHESACGPEPVPVLERKVPWMELSVKSRAKESSQKREVVNKAVSTFTNSLNFK